jgi:regulator of replication initiation timing
MSEIKIEHNQFIGVYENGLSRDECKNIIDLFKDDLNNKVDENGDAQFHKDKMERLDYQKFYLSSDKSNQIVSKINNVLDKCINLYAEEFWIVKQLKATSLEIKLQKTPPRGGYHVWHCEQSGRSVADRVLAWTIYLNDIPSGEGETEFLWQGLRVQPKAGTVSIFPASFTHTHRGNPVYSCDKYIATGWYTLYE